MRLTHWTDYSLRVLMYCAACEGREHPPTVNEIAEAHGISRSHLTKIVMILASFGWLATTRGRGGGLRLLKPAGELTLGEVVRQTETDMTLVECFDRKTNTCRLDGYCRLKDVLYKATQGFFDVLDGITLADLLAPVATGKAQAGQMPHLIPIQLASLKMPRTAPVPATKAAPARRPSAARKPGKAQAD
ncbi:MAG: Rrf2 family transcriptional regulator [Hydrogenophaga sp.]|uniref:RrF2 family transcriptional regulator n=1 Tax=Hydrogenophaga sp. TaxID=1904254 RepID=UPI0025B88F8F|nr:Rrf2 family transcriptional regulator [Hydrogenophaga sp.]MBT9551142.1 Rrf2 family transcriptional regulator [Hydrogenophaga sp.]